MTAQRWTLGVDLRSLVTQPTGVGYATLELLRKLAAMDTVRIVGLAHRAPEAQAKLQSLGVSVEVQRAPSGALWQQVRLPVRLRKGDIDLLWSPLLTLPRWLPIPAVVTVHDLTPVLYPDAHTWRTRWSTRLFLRSSLTRATSIVASSHATQRDLEERYPQTADRVDVVHLGVGAEFRPGQPAEIETTRQALECPDGYMLYAGTLEPRKNVDGLLGAWKALVENGANPLPLVLAGPAGWHSGALLDAIEAARPLGVQYLGRVSRNRLIQLVQAASAFAYVSHYEGFGLPPLEAMACGVPVVVSNRSSLPEVVGDAALLVDPTDPRAIGEALTRLTRDEPLRHGLAEAGRARAQHLNWVTAAERLVGVFERARHPGRARPA